jgi:hypothetical protein
MGFTIAKKMDLADKNPLHMNVLVVESERPALRNHRDNTRSLAYPEGSKTPLRHGSPGTIELGVKRIKPHPEDSGTAQGWRKRRK